MPEGSSTSGASSGGATAGIVGQAITSTSSKRAARRRRISVRTRVALTAAAAGSSIRYLVKPRLIRLSSGLSRLSRSGVDAAHALGVGDQDRRQRRGGEVGQRDLADLAAGLLAERLDRRLAGLADLGGDVLGDGVADDPDPQARGVAGASSSPNSAEPSRRQSAASAQSGPETIIVVTAAMWCPSIAERAKVGFSPVRPQ